ncbi:DUF6338 family protein [Haloarcula sp. S1AR25-5A]|uniref:DUF6338 family protein n=1 Tax=Haloarcula terrestris TaxID=2950533 RepID=A0AAE4EZF7_9EURY|nr:DUF6338 family protein [Haloarcula terrestris]MDS0223120.1 DUF6338 family protein [Haloarcula terrestris]
MLLSLPDSVVLLAILLPGYVLTYVLLWQARVPDTFTEAEKQAFSLTGSALLAFAGYLLYVSVTSIIRREIILLPELRFTLQESLVVLSMLTLAAIPVGYAIGTLYDIRFHQRRSIFRTRRKTWDYIHQEANSPVVAAIKTPSGAEIQGDIQYAGEREQNDLLLRNPLLKDSEGEVVRRLGRYTYLPEEEIDRIDIFTELKQRRKLYSEKQKHTATATPSVSVPGTDLRRSCTDKTVLEVQLQNETSDDVYTEVVAEFIGEGRCILDEGIAVVPIMRGGERRSVRFQYNGSPDTEIVDTEVRLSPISIAD